MGVGCRLRQETVRGWRAWVGLAVLVLLTGVGCGAEVIEKEEPSPGSGSGGGGTVLETTSDKLDLLLVVDNSRSMAQMQQLLQLSVSDLLGALVNPPCLENGLIVELPADPAAPCNAGTRAYHPVTDVHIGVISSSLGGHGADACNPSNSGPLYNHFSANDKAHLLSRISTESPTPAVETWQDTGFLVWDPTASSHAPPGHSDMAALQGQLNDILGGVGEVGCGFEATLESWYRFLIDPDPYQSIEVQDGLAVTLGTDDALLAQRRDFLRPDSQVSIIMISNENDCSIRDGGFAFWAAQHYLPETGQPFHMDKPRAACAQDPNDPCCRSCAQLPADGCDTSADDCGKPLSSLDDFFGLRCFDQKRRFGVDMLYPVARYTDGLTQAQIYDRHGDLHDNPLLMRQGVARSPELVKLTGIVGVPWQDIARQDSSGVPRTALGFRNAGELMEEDLWPLLVGDPDNYVAPLDPFMVESIEPRSGVNPLTGDAITAPGQSELPNVVNGHEYLNEQRNDLQFTCIYPLVEDRDCGPGSTEVFCECDDPENDLPLCVADSASGFPHIQRYGRSTPGVRHLQLLSQLGDRAAVASICAEQTSDPSAADFGYRPAMRAAIELMASGFAGP